MGTANDDGTTGTPPAPAATGTPAPKTAEQVKLETALAAIKEKNTKELWAQAKAASKIREAYKEMEGTREPHSTRGTRVRGQPREGGICCIAN